MKKYLIVLFCLLLSTPLQAQDRITLLLDWFINPDHGPIIIAQEKGYFAEWQLERLI
jgi:putative hydroxymethylpyrimidine transport system substrate-binding protein